MSTVPTPDADATLAVGTIRLDVTTLAELVARLVVRGLVAHAAADDLDGRNGPYVPGLARGVPPRIGEHGPATDRLLARLCPSCAEEMWVEPDAAPDILCATCQQHGDLRAQE